MSHSTHHTGRTCCLSLTLQKISCFKVYLHIHPNAIDMLIYIDICSSTLLHHPSWQTSREQGSVKPLYEARDRAIRVERPVAPFREKRWSSWKKRLLIFYSLLCSHSSSALFFSSLQYYSSVWFVHFVHCFLGDEIEASWYARLP